MKVSFRTFPDPFETQNRYGSLTPAERHEMHETLEQLKRCRGRGCTIQRLGMIDEPFNIQQRGIKRKYDSIGKKHWINKINL